MWFDIDFITNCIVRESSIERRGTHAAMEAEFREIDELGNWNAVYQVKDWFFFIIDYDALNIHNDLTVFYFHFFDVMFIFLTAQMALLLPYFTE